MLGARRASLRELLAENRTYDPEYSYGLANHLSMTLSALAALGADDGVLTSFAEHYRTRLRPLRQGAPLSAGDWRASLGSPSALVGLIQHFERELSVRDRAAVLRDVLAAATPGLAAGAFHGLIRTAYALHAEEDAELAHALGYFVMVAQPLRPLPAPRATSAASPHDLLELAASDPRLTKGISGQLITDALRVAVEQPGFDDFVAALRVGPDTLDELAQAALDLYVHTLDFGALHAVTSTHALRLLLPHSPDPELALRYQFQALLAVSLTIPASSHIVPSTAPLPDWSGVAAAALQSDDDHDSKLVYTCREESALRLPDDYRRAASLRMRLL